MARIKVEFLRPFGSPNIGRTGQSALTRRRLLLGAGGILALAATTGSVQLVSRSLAESPATPGQDLSYFRIGGGALGSRLYQLAGTVAGAITNPPGQDSCDEKSPCGVPGIVGLAQTTTGSVENLQNLFDGSIESAVTQADVAGDGLAGTGAFKGTGAYDRLRCLAQIGGAHVQVVVATGSPLTTLADLKGKVVAVGPKLSDSALTAPVVLAAAGVTAKRVKLDYSDMQAAVAKLADGSVDAIVMVDGMPNADIAALADRSGIRLLAVDGAVREKLLNDRPYLRAGTIAAKTYPGTAEVGTIVVPILWAVSADLDSQLAYNLAKALGSQVAQGGKKLGQVDIALAADTAPLQLHPGAQRYFDERKAAGAIPSTN